MPCVAPQRNTFPRVPNTFPKSPFGKSTDKALFAPLCFRILLVQLQHSNGDDTRIAFPPLPWLVRCSPRLSPHRLPPPLSEPEFVSQIGPDLQKLSPIYCSTLCFQGLFGSSVIIYPFDSFPIHRNNLLHSLFRC